MDSVVGNSIGYVMIYTSHELEITSVSHTNIFSQLSEILLFLTLSPTHQVLVNLQPPPGSEHHVSDAWYVPATSIYIHALDKSGLIAVVYIFTLCIYVYYVYMYINVWPALIGSMKTEARRREKQWTFGDINENVP